MYEHMDELYHNYRTASTDPYAIKVMNKIIFKTKSNKIQIMMMLAGEPDIVEDTYCICGHYVSVGYLYYCNGTTFTLGTNCKALLESSSDVSFY